MNVFECGSAPSMLGMQVRYLAGLLKGKEDAPPDFVAALTRALRNATVQFHKETASRTIFRSILCASPVKPGFGRALFV